MSTLEGVLVKAPHKKQVFTEEQLNEFLLCADPETGPEYFMDHYFYKGRIVGTKHWYTFMQENRIPSLAPYLEKKHIQSQIWLPNLLCK